MNKTKLIEEFKKKVLAEVPSFILEDTDKGWKNLLTTVKIGNAVFVYGNYYKNTVSLAYKSKLELIAISANDKIYMVNPYKLSTFDSESFDDTLVSYEEGIKNLNKEIKEKFLMPFIEGLETVELAKEALPRVIRHARKILLYKNDCDCPTVIKINSINTNMNIEFINDENFSEYLTGELNLEKVVAEKLEKHRFSLIQEKSRALLVKELVDNKSCVKQWEFDMANAIGSYNEEANLTVTFNYNGKEGTVKIKVGKILFHKLIDEDDFSIWDCSCHKDGETLLKKLGAGTYEERLKCEHITKITYGKKTLYERGA